MTRFLVDIGDLFEWTSVVCMIGFLIQYSIQAPWWRNFVGRSIVMLDIAILGLLIPACIELAKPHWHAFFASNWMLGIEVLVLLTTTLVPLTRMIGFTKTRRYLLQDNRTLADPPSISYDVKDLIDDLTDRVEKLEQEQHDEDHNKKLALAWVTVGGSIIFSVSAAVGIVAAFH